MIDQIFIEIADFASFARYACHRENSLRIYCHDLNKEKVFSSRQILSSSLLSFYVPAPKKGRYISYSVKGGREEYYIADSTKTVSNYAPIIHLASLPSSISVNPKKLKDKFKPIQIENLDSLARLTYDPELPEESERNLFAFPHKQKWVIGYLTSVDLENIEFFFNYVVEDKEPSKPFLQYSYQETKDPIFTDKFQHGYTYLPIVKLKNEHRIFGLNF